MHALKIQYFAAARDLAGRAEEQVTLERSPVAVRELLVLLGARHAPLSTVIHRMRLAVNGEIAGDAVLVHAGDEIAVLPPVAGGSRPSDPAPVSCSVVDTPLSVDALITALSGPEIGGIALFLGTVRDHADGKAVARLDYEAHPLLAHKELLRVCGEVLRTHPGARLGVVHRVGTLSIGDLAIIVGAGAAHRAEAFDTCREAVEQIKARVPIWKKEWAPDGSANWVNL
jgi:molybdopterin synthase catalytic subunit